MLRVTPIHHRIFSGKPSLPHDPTRKVLKYTPPWRRPHHPAYFGRENLTPADLQKEWDSARGKTGPAHYDSGYSTKKEITYEDVNVPLIPTHELSKILPDITIPKSQSTPVSMMHVRNGHRITHDLIHSYDRHLTLLNKYKDEKDIEIDHDNITPQDEGKHGLHPATFGSRSAIYRYLRRAPYTEETFYYKRYVQPYKAPPNELELQSRIISHAKKDDLDAATSVYRTLVHPPTRETLVALMQCCARLGLLADAAALFDDAMKMRNLKLARDPEVLEAYMDAAIRGQHPVRVLSVLGIIVGTYTENVTYNAGLSDVAKAKLGRKALSWLLTSNHGAEARTCYTYLTTLGLIEYDSYEVMAKEIASELFGTGNTNSTVLPVPNNVPYATNAKQANYLVQYHVQHMNYIQSPATGYSTHWLEQEFEGTNVDFVLRLARSLAPPDLAADTLDAAVAKKAHDFLLLLHPKFDRTFQHFAPLPYLHKSKPSAQNPNIRIVPFQGELETRKLMPHEAGYTFGYTPGMSYVTESLPVLQLDAKHLYYGRYPEQQPATMQTWFNKTIPGPETPPTGPSSTSGISSPPPTPTAAQPKESATA